MLKLTASVTDRGALGSGLRTRLTLLQRAEQAARAQGAATATSVSRASIHRLRPAPPPRHGRYSGLAGAVEWKPNSFGVELDLAKLNTDFPPWLVQEIGTGERAIQGQANATGNAIPVGRPRSGATYVKTVRSQVGRPIKGFLVWATRGGQYTPPGAATGQQLYLRSQVKGAPVRFDTSTNRYAANIRIGKEIKGQHFLRDGGQAGFREYRSSVLAAARTQLGKKR